jgi:hypothetical protein
MFKAPLSASLALFPFFLPIASAQQNPTALQIFVVAGDGAINNVKQRVNPEPVVQVEDENHRPIVGAAVVFFLPSQGPSGTFSSGSTTLATTTNAQGQASAPGIRFNALAGPMQIRVTASYGGQAASLNISQTNVIGAGSAGGSAGTGMSRGTKIAIIVAVAAAGGIAGAVVGKGGGSGSSSSTGSPPVTLSPGAVTVGGPQ